MHEGAGFLTKTLEKSLFHCKMTAPRIARENLVNYDDAAIYHNDKNAGI